jgi:tRNA (cytidine/uridine-2'-O-)-methyltransferase
MFDVILFEPEIPPNTGNVMRLCANTGTSLHLVGRLGFELDDRRLRRAGLDYREWAAVHRHGSLSECVESLNKPRLFTFSAKSTRVYAEAEFEPGDALLFGPETRGLPPAVRDSVPEERRLYLPMQPRSRSLNLSNVVAVVVYEAWKQQAFKR